MRTVTFHALWRLSLRGCCIISSGRAFGEQGSAIRSRKVCRPGEERALLSLEYTLYARGDIRWKAALFPKPGNESNLGCYQPHPELSKQSSSWRKTGPEALSLAFCCGALLLSVFWRPALSVSSESLLGMQTPALPTESEFTFEQDL